MAHVRDRPSLRESVEITTPAGNRYRWGDDEDNAANVPSGERYTDTMPGGFAEHEAVLPRKASVDYADLERLSTLTRYDASGGIIWQGRLERAPKVSGDQIAISPSAVGWQAHLEDDKSATAVYIDRDLGRWAQATSPRRLDVMLAATTDMQEFRVAPSGDGYPTLILGLVGPWARQTLCEAFYFMPSGSSTGALRFSYATNSNVALGDPNWVADIYTGSLSGTVYNFTSLDADWMGPATTGSVSANASGANRGIFMLRMYYNTGPAGGDGVSYECHVRSLRVFDDHGLTLRGDTADEEGYYASDVVTHAVGRWAPLLTVTSESVTESSFVIPQMAFHDPTTAAEIVRQATRFGLQDWAVWEDLTFWWHDRGARGTKWRARVGPSQLEETGPQVERIWESVIVQYQDVDQSTKTAGPVGAGTDTETDDLKDDDPDNPANKLGIPRRALLTMEIGTAASATEVGRRFLEESRLLDSSGRARLIGHVQDSHGVWHPYSHVRAGDTISFVDSNDTSYRRIVRTDKTRDDRSCSVDLDAPPEGLQALLERLGVVLVPLGL